MKVTCVDKHLFLLSGLFILNWLILLSPSDSQYSTICTYTRASLTCHLVWQTYGHTYTEHYRRNSRKPPKYYQLSQFATSTIASCLHTIASLTWWCVVIASIAFQFPPIGRFIFIQSRQHIRTYAVSLLCCATDFKIIAGHMRGSICLNFLCKYSHLSCVSKYKRWWQLKQNVC